MPIYEYRCAACGRLFTEYSRTVRPREEDVCPPCPSCLSTETTRTVGSFIVRGDKQADPREASHQNAQYERQSQVTSREQIDAYRKSGDRTRD